MKASHLQYNCYYNDSTMHSLEMFEIVIDILIEEQKQEEWELEEL